MNRQQLTYFCDRIDQLKAKAITTIKDKHTVPSVKMSDEEKGALLASVGLRCYRNDNGYIKHIDDKPEHISEDGEKAITAICIAAQKAKDTVMLDDANAVLALETLSATLTTLTA